MKNNCMVASYQYEPEHIFSLPIVNHVYNERTGVRETIDTLLQGESSDIWSQALSNE